MARTPHWSAPYPTYRPEISRAQILWLPSAATPRLISDVLLAPTDRHQIDDHHSATAAHHAPGHGARVHLRHRVRGRAQDPVHRGPARARQCRLRRRQARAPPRARRLRQEVLDPRRQERPRDHQPAMARRLAPRRLRVRPAGSGQRPGVPQVVQGGGADPRAVGDGGGAGHLCGSGVERHPVVRGRGRPGRHRALLLRVAAGHAAAADGVGGVEAVGGLLQPGLAGRGVGHAVVAHRRELLQLHRRPGVPWRQVLRPAQPRRHHQGRRLHPRPGEARAAQAGGDQARPARHARHAHLLLRGRTGQDAARRARPMSRPLIVRV